MHLRLEADAGHAPGLLDALLVVDHVLLGQHVEHLLVGGYRHGPRRVEDALEILGHHLLILDRHDSVGVQAADVGAGDADVHRMNLAAGHELRLIDGALDRLHRGVDVDDHTLFHALGRVRADTDHLDGPVGTHLADDGHHL